MLRYPHILPSGAFLADIRHPRRTLALFLLASCLAVHCDAQGRVASPQIRGDVHTAAGDPARGATVTLTAPDGAVTQATADSNGEFAFPASAPGLYRLLAVTAAEEGDAISVQRDASAIMPLHLLLHRRPSGAVVPHKVTSGSTAVEFTDAPTFTVAGVTDWTAVGGHGSDATLRTSEDLTRQTVRLNAAPITALPFDQAAANRLQADLATNRESYDANHALGELYLRSGKFAQAVPPLQRASVAHGSAAADEYLLAQACAGVGDITQARRHVQLALTKQQAGPYFRLAGELDEQSGDALAAVQQLQRAVAADPTEANYLAWGSELLLHRAIQQASQVFAQGTARFPQSSRLRMGWGSALFAGAHYGKAAEQLCRASDLDPSDREPYLLLGKAAIAAPEPLPCAAPTLARFLQLEPNNATAHFDNGMLLLRQGTAADRAKAEALFKQAVALNPHDAEAWLQVGILATAQHHDAESIARFRRAIAADSQLAEAHYRLGVALDRAGQHEEAQRELQQHEMLLKTQADAVERQRKEVKQFVVALPPIPSSATAP